eukprot:Blabericola_migrator_1__12098@NODE_745_length_6664_cov_146_664090_g535_i0_p5_GENE_NODE_745_length_6664_cov_146_664090_g535_i0NODE_745_length_6664_cov_146_664090_g535_i0_p5_ORF_typecomplete_len220_score20_58_NODE_745_length_6664_cov_146_664090_g535_i024263085
MKPLRLRIEKVLHQIFQVLPTSAQIASGFPPHGNSEGGVRFQTNIKSYARSTHNKAREHYKRALESLSTEETRGLASRVVACGLAQGAVGFSLGIATAVFHRANEVRRYYIAGIPRPLRPAKRPMFVPALVQGYRSAITGMSSSLVDELLLKYRGEDKAASNAFLSGCCIGILESRREGFGTMVEEALRNGTTAWLFRIILGAGEELSTTNDSDEPVAK